MSVQASYEAPDSATAEFEFLVLYDVSSGEELVACPATGGTASFTCGYDDTLLYNHQTYVAVVEPSDGCCSGPLPPKHVVAESSLWVDPQVWSVSLTRSGGSLTETSNFPIGFYSLVWPDFYDVTTDEWSECVPDVDGASCTDSGYSTTDTYVAAVVTASSNSSVRVLASSDPSIVPVSPGADGTPTGPSIAEQGGALNPSELSTTCTCGDPVNTESGQFVQSGVGVTVPGRGVPLALGLTYVSGRRTVNGPFGFGWASSYGMRLATSSTGVVTITQEDGSTVEFFPGVAGSYIPDTGVLATLTAGADGSFVFRRNHSGESFTFNSAGRLVDESDRNGYTTKLTYTGSDLTSVADASGRTLTFAYSGSDVVSVTDPLGRVIQYAYDSDGNLVTATDPLSRTTSYGYDSSHELTTVTSPRGGTTTNVYNTAGKVTSQTDPAGLTSSWAYSGNPQTVAGATTRLTDPHGNVSKFAYLLGRLVSESHGTGAGTDPTTYYAYDVATNGQTSVTDPNGHQTTSDYDNDGNLIDQTDPLGNKTVYTYNTLDEQTSVALPGGQISKSSYDSSGNLLTSTDAAGKITTYSYADAAHPGDVTSVRDPDGHVTSFSYDAHGDRVTSTVTPQSGQVETTTAAFDADGEQTKVTDPLGHSTTTAHDADGEATKVTDPLGHVTTTTYNADGGQAVVTDPVGRKQSTTYDLDDRPITHTVGTSTTSAATTRYKYDLAAGTAPCTGVSGAVFCDTTTDPSGQVTITFYDTQAQQIARVRPGGQTTLYAYDPAGNLTVTTNPSGQKETNTYNADDQVTRSAFSSGMHAVSLSYNTDGMNWMASLQKGIADPSTRFTVSLDGMSGSSTYQQVMGAATRGASGAGGYTDWEMAQLFQGERLPDVTFVRGGSVVENPWVP